MSKVYRVFIDTSAWIMLLNADENRYQEAVATYDDKLKSAEKYTSNMIIGETYTWLRIKAGYQPAMEFLHTINTMLEKDLLILIRSGKESENLATGYLQKYKDHRISYVDAVSFAIMKELDIKEAFTFDKHFSIAGFTPLNPL